MNFPQLSLLAQEHGAATLAWLAEPVAAPSGEIPRRAVKMALMALGMDKYHAVSATLGALFTDGDFDSLDVLSPLFAGILQQLQSGGILTADDVLALTALGMTQVPRWQALGFPALPTQTDIDLAPAP